MNMDKNDKVFCEICNQQTKYSRDTFSYNHLKKVHNINMQQYYDMFYKKETDDICNHPECNKKTRYYGINRGYAKYCSMTCLNTSSIHAKQISDSYNYRDMKKEREKRNNTRLEKYGDSEYTNRKLYKETMIENHGVEHNFLLDDCIENRKKVLEDNKEEINKKRSDSWTDEKKEKALDKRVETCLEKHGVDNVFKLENVKQQISNILIKSGKWGDYSKLTLSDYEKYNIKVWKETYKWTGQLYKEWDGICYYSKIKCLLNKEYRTLCPDKHVNTNKLQPTVDHKNSVIYGFRNNIDPIIIGHIDNLCICSRSENSKKNYRSINEYCKCLI